MSLSNTYWNAARKNAGVQETWLVQLYYDTETNFIGLCDRDITISGVQYDGIVIDSGTIVNTIDLAKSQATTDNVEITARNIYKNQSFAKELLYGTRKYLNRKVLIYSRMGDATSLSDCQLLDVYRLYNIVQNSDGTISLQIEKKSVWDHIAIPSLKDNAVYYPVAYGDFQPQGTDSITGDNRVEGNDSDMSSSTNHSYEADPTDPPAHWDINSTVSGKMYIALEGQPSGFVAIRHKQSSNLFSPGTYNISLKGRTASGSGAKLYIGPHPTSSATGQSPFTQATTGTETTYTGTFTLGTGETQLYISAVADVGTATQAFEIDDLSITYTGSDTVTNNKRMYPTNYMPFKSGNDRFVWAVGKSAASGAEPYYYDSSMDQLQKMTTASTATTAYSNGDYIYFDNLNRFTTLQPVDYSSVGTHFSNPSNLTDKDISTYAYTYVQCSQAVITSTQSITLEFPSISEKTVNGKFYLKGAWVINYYTGSGVFSFDVAITVGGVTVFGESGITNSTVSAKVGVINKASFTNDTGITLEYQDTSLTYGNVTIVSRMDLTPTSGTYTIEAGFRLYDAYFEVDIQPDYSSDPDSESLEHKRITTQGYTLWEGDVRTYSNFLLNKDQINQSKQSNICTAIDGFSQGYTGGSGLAVNVHEVYRDLLQRFTGFDVADASLVGWADLDADRSDWAVRWWKLEPYNLKSALDKLQYEGCFIFKFYQNGGKFIYVKDDPSVDLVAVINDTDYDNMTMKLSDFSEIVTHTEYNYEKHPAKGNYLSSSTYTNSTSRTTWWPAIATEENKKSINLDYLVKNPYDAAIDSNPNDCIALYYDNIIAEPKMLIECEIVNKALFNLEDGDIVQFNISLSGVETMQPFGKNWADIYFMITKTKRSLSALKISARYVYTI